MIWSRPCNAWTTVKKILDAQRPTLTVKDKQFTIVKKTAAQIGNVTKRLRMEWIVKQKDETVGLGPNLRYDLGVKDGSSRVSNTELADNELFEVNVGRDVFLS